MGCNVPSEVVGFDDGFQPEAIVWANPTRLDRAQNPPSTDTSVYKTFVKSPRRLLVFIASHSFFTNYSTTRETYLRSSSKGMVGSRGSGVQRHHLESATTTTGSGPRPFDERDRIQWGSGCGDQNPIEWNGLGMKNRCDVLSHFISSAMTELPQSRHREVDDTPTQPGRSRYNHRSDRRLLAVALRRTTALAVLAEITRRKLPTAHVSRSQVQFGPDR